MVSIFMEKLHAKRVPVTICVMLAAFMLALPSTLRYGVWENVTIFGYQILDFFDFISNNIAMPIVALITAILIGYAVKPQTVIEEVELNGKFKSEKLYIFMIKFVVPVFMAVILVSSIFGIV